MVPGTAAKTTARRRHGVRPSSDIQHKVALLVEEHGVRGASLVLGIGRDSTARVALGELVLSATLVVVGVRLAERAMTTSAAA